MLEGLVIKLAFVYTVSEKSIYYKNITYTPTIRVATEIYPTIKLPHASVAASNVNSIGTIKPLIILRGK